MAQPWGFVGLTAPMCLHRSCVYRGTDGQPNGAPWSASRFPCARQHQSCVHRGNKRPAQRNGALGLASRLPCACTDHASIAGTSGQANGTARLGWPRGSHVPATIMRPSRVQTASLTERSAWVGLTVSHVPAPTTERRAWVGLAASFAVGWGGVRRAGRQSPCRRAWAAAWARASAPSRRASARKGRPGTRGEPSWTAEA